MLSTEDEEELEFVEERTKTEKKKRKNKPKTAKRRLEPLGEYGFYDDTFYNKVGRDNHEDDVIENVKMDIDYDSQKPKSKKKHGGGTISRKRKVCNEDELDD
jgi:hypothetical protein